MNAMTEAEELFARLDREARAGGYLLNADRKETLSLCEGLLVNTGRYGYPSCPCRLAEGRREPDLDIICPCDYRDADLNEFGACYCGLYVTKEWNERRIERKVVPERRPPREAREKRDAPGETAPAAQGSRLGGRYPVWRCRVCGYLCARDHPPDVCPICKVTKERFERFA